MIGKNAPCPCGSGKKYKRCCMRKKPESRPVGNIGPTRLDEVRRDVPVVDEDGCRIVSPAQASMDFIEPLMEKMKPESGEDIQAILNTGMLLWNIALNEKRTGQESGERRLASKALANLGLPAPDAWLDRMVERHHAMFPDAGDGKGGFYERERVIDRPSWTVFDEDSLPLDEFAPADTEADRLARSAIEEFDSLIGQVEVLSREMPRIGGAFEEGLGGWLERTGCSAEQIETLLDIAGRFLDFLFQYRGEPLGGMPERCVTEFLMTWLFRKARLGGQAHSAAPWALLFLGNYLDRLGCTQGLEKRLHKAFFPLLDEFGKTLEAFYGPSDSPLEIH
jgi:hypothetical protein